LAGAARSTLRFTVKQSNPTAHTLHTPRFGLIFFPRVSSRASMSPSTNNIRPPPPPPPPQTAQQEIDASQPVSQSANAQSLPLVLHAACRPVIPSSTSSSSLGRRWAAAAAAGAATTITTSQHGTATAAAAAPGAACRGGRRASPPVLDSGGGGGSRTRKIEGLAYLLRRPPAPIRSRGTASAPAPPPAAEEQQQQQGVGAPTMAAISGCHDEQEAPLVSPLLPVVGHPQQLAWGRSRRGHRRRGRGRGRGQQRDGES
jgi:hypothetical protein